MYYLWGGAPQVQQNTAAWTVAFEAMDGPRKSFLIELYYHTVIQAHKTIKSGKLHPYPPSIPGTPEVLLVAELDLGRLLRLTPACHPQLGKEALQYLRGS